MCNENFINKNWNYDYMTPQFGPQCTPSMRKVDGLERQPLVPIARAVRTRLLKNHQISQINKETNN